MSANALRVGRALQDVADGGLDAALPVVTGLAKHLSDARRELHGQQYARRIFKKTVLDAAMARDE